MTSFTSNNKAPYTVFVEGNIGSGKTTFLNHFRQFQDVCLMTEPVENWRNLNVRYYNCVHNKHNVIKYFFMLHLGSKFTRPYV